MSAASEPQGWPLSIARDHVRPWRSMHSVSLDTSSRRRSASSGNRFLILRERARTSATTCTGPPSTRRGSRPRVPASGASAVTKQPETATLPPCTRHAQGSRHYCASWSAIHERGQNLTRAQYH